MTIKRVQQVLAVFDHRYSFATLECISLSMLCGNLKTERKDRKDRCSLKPPTTMWNESRERIKGHYLRNKERKSVRVCEKACFSSIVTKYNSCWPMDLPGALFLLFLIITHLHLFLFPVLLPSKLATIHGFLRSLSPMIFMCPHS